MACQGHPAFGLDESGFVGAAHALFRALEAEAGCEAWFLGCDDGTGLAAGVELRGAVSQPFGARDYVARSLAFDGFRLAQRDTLLIDGLRALVARLRPDVVHLWGLDRLGVDFIGVIRQAAPAARIVVTPDGFDAICAHDGLMLTRPDLRPCPAASLAGCSRCFAERGPTQVFLRTRWVRHFLDQADHIVARGAVQYSRFVAWGIAPERISHVADPAPVMEILPAREADGMLRLGYFGPTTADAGFDTVLEAARLLQAAGNRVVQFDVVGTGIVPPGNMRLHGVGVTARALLGRLDGVVVPGVAEGVAPGIVSVALGHGRPMLHADSATLSEAVGQDGIGFPSGDPVALAALLERLGAMPHLLPTVGARMGGSGLEAMLELYRGR